MKSSFQSCLALPTAALLAACSLLTVSHAADQADPCPSVSLGESGCGSECVMVFARVGERFHYELTLDDESSISDCVVGENADGNPSALPPGLVFDPEAAVLEGVPQRAGFHEFVVQATREGMTHEQVVLIDIQGHSFAGGGIDYASYFSGGVR